MEFSLDESENPEKGAKLLKELVAFNASQVPPSGRKPFLISVEEHGSLKAGIQGYSHWGWLYVAHLWVEESKRGSGLGRELMKRAEGLAIERGCRKIWLDTFSFQALGFYESLGYRKFGELSDFPPGHTRFFLTKSLR
jgi:ribosomal protein S18 acetylase RimI-like enzyme